MEYICKICNNEFNNVNGLSKHVSMLHKIKLLDYYIKYEDFEIPKCPYCGKNCKIRGCLIFCKTCGDKECISKSYKNRTVSDKTKLKISKSMKISHKNGNHIGWSFINSDINRRSYPEKYFVSILKDNQLYSKYTIKEKLPFGKYFLDFAFIDIKTDVEIDGQQHFRTKKCRNHDIERDNFLLDNDWKVYRIAWIELKNNPNLIIQNFLSWLKENIELYHKYDVNEVLKLIKKHNPVYGNRNDYHKAKRNNSIIKNKPKVDLILNSGIDFSKFGWVRKVSELLNINHGKVNKWMKLYMPEFYKTKCFVRKK
jgi:very-short-patch-repair endonuclease